MNQPKFNFSLKQLLFVTFIVAWLAWMIIPEMALPEDSRWNDNKEIHERYDQGILFLCIFIPMLLIMFFGFGCLMYFMNAILSILIFKMPHGSWQIAGMMAMIILNGFCYLMVLKAMSDGSYWKALEEIEKKRQSNAG